MWTKRCSRIESLTEKLRVRERSGLRNLKSESGKPETVLDAKPLVKLFAQEEGGDAVQKILFRVEAGDLEAAISVVTLTEIYYKCMKEKRADLAEERTNQLVCALYLYVNFACPACTPSAICACHYMIFS